METGKSNHIYSSVYSIVMLTILISFVASRELSLATLAENFRWRKSLIEIYTSLRFEFGDRIFNKAVVGSDGWIFYTGELSVRDYQHTIPMLTRELSNLQKSLDQLNERLEEENITLIVVVPPNKTTIYPQFVPGEIPVLNKTSRLDQFVEYMKENGKTTVVDLRPALLNASLSQDVYYKTDTHWNSLGAYYGYVEIMNVLARKYPELGPHPLSDFEYENTGYDVKDIPKMMGLSNYKEENRALIPKFKIDLNQTSTILHFGADAARIVTNKNNASSLKLLVFHDSFYNALSAFIEPHFDKVVTVPFTDKKEIWSLDWIQREEPNIVIIEVVERYLDASLPKLLNN